MALPVTSPEERERYDRRDAQQRIVEAACAWYEQQLRRPQGRVALDYLKGRGLSDETIARFRLGYAPDGRDGLKAKLLKEGVEERALLEAGLISQPDDGRAAYDFLRHRVTFPITDPRGRVIAFGGRALADGGPKYLNSRDTPLFHKGTGLYGVAHAREPSRKAGEIIVAEGYMDVIALHQAGIGHAVAPLGTALTEQQIELLWRMAPEPVLCFDGDNAGRRAAARAAERALPMLKPGYSLRFAYLPKGEDPDSLVRSRGADAMLKVVTGAKPMIDVVWETAFAGKKVDTPERRALVRKELRDRAARIAERSVQEGYLVEIERRLSDAFGQVRRGGGQWSRAQRGGPGNRRFEPGTPDLGLRSDTNVQVLELRQEQALLAAMVNHPWLVADFGEEVGTLRVGSGDLDKLRQEIIKAWIPDLDSADLERHLSDHGFRDILNRILCREVYELAPFARRGAEADTVRRGWAHLYDRCHRRQSFDSEIEAAREAFAADPSKRNWAYLDALMRRVDSSDDENSAPAGGTNGLGS